MSNLPVVLSLLTSAAVIGSTVAFWSAARILNRHVVGDPDARKPIEVTIRVTYDDGERENLPIAHPETQQAIAAINELRHAGNV